MTKKRNTGLYRFPGTHPFSKGQEDVFFGREDATKNLYRIINFEQVVVLFAKSGTGKTSIINAGIIPAVIKNDKFIPIIVRFGSYIKEYENLPHQIIRSLLSSYSTSSVFLEKIIPDDGSIWFSIKKIVLNDKKNRDILLIFDQFEEIFTYPNDAISHFGRQLDEVLRSDLPQRVLRVDTMLQQSDPDLVSDIERGLLYKELKTKVLFSIRSDRLSLLDRLTPFIPNILDNRFELFPLTLSEASNAIQLPAQKDGPFISNKFYFEPDALNFILNYLSNNKKNLIESFQLQLFCRSFEEKIIDSSNNFVTLNDVSSIEKIEKIFEDYYEDKINKIPKTNDRKLAKKLIEYGLIFAKERRRLSLFEGQLLEMGISKEIISQLEDTHLIRRESAGDSFIYEISHETLVTPILNSRRRQEMRNIDISKILNSVFPLSMLIIIIYLSVRVYYLTQEPKVEVLAMEKAQEIVENADLFNTLELYRKKAILNPLLKSKYDSILNLVLYEVNNAAKFNVDVLLKYRLEIRDDNIIIKNAEKNKIIEYSEQFFVEYYKNKGTPILWKAKIEMSNLPNDTTLFKVSKLAYEVTPDGFFELHKIYLIPDKIGNDVSLKMIFKAGYGSGIFFPPRENDYRDIFNRYNQSYEAYKINLFTKYARFILSKYNQY